MAEPTQNPSKPPPGEKPIPNGDGTMIQYGAYVRMDRNPTPQNDGTFIWNVYTLQPVTDGSHPVHGDATTEIAVWMPHGQGSEDDAKNLCTQLSGIK